MGPDVVSRSRRADAEQNRARLIEVALRAFAESGSERVSLEAIAREAGLGIGTLYRHFHKREALVEAVYRSQLARLLSRADELLATEAPDVALRAWMEEFAGWVHAKKGMVESLRAMSASGAINRSETRDQLAATIERFLGAGVAANQFRAGVRPDDMLASLTGIFLVSGDSHESGQAGRLLDLLMDGLRYAASSGRSTMR
jgi:AcrR family transcriptional regulator